MAAKESSVFSHLDREGRARMVDISAKPRVKRSASAAGKRGRAATVLPTRVRTAR